MRLISLARLVFPALLVGSPSLAFSQGSSTATSETSAGETALVARQYSEAMQHFEAALTARPTDAEARRGEIAAATALALEQAREPNPETSLTTLAHASAVLPDEPELLLDLGIEATTLNQFALADKSLHAALSLRPGDAKTTYALARLEVEEQHMPDAERDLKAYLAMRPDDASAWFGLGHVYAMEQRNEDARQAFQTSLKLHPDQTESYYQLGQIDLNLQHDAEAAVSFGKVLARDPKHAGALTGMGQLALRAKQYTQAEQYLAQAESSDPSYPPPHYYRGLALAKLGRNEEAQQELRKGDSRPHATPLPNASSP